MPVCLKCDMPKLIIQQIIAVLEIVAGSYGAYLATKLFIISSNLEREMHALSRSSVIGIIVFLLSIFLIGCGVLLFLNSTYARKIHLYLSPFIVLILINNFSSLIINFVVFLKISWLVNMNAVILLLIFSSGLLIFYVLYFYKISREN